MRSDVERAASSAILRDYGDFFKRQQLETCSANPGSSSAVVGGVIQAEYYNHEPVPVIELSRSDNALVTKIVGVFSALCVEIEELKKEAHDVHLPVMSVCGEISDDKGCSGGEVGALCRTLCFIRRCQQTINNFCLQLFSLYSYNLVNLHGVQIHYLISEMSELGVILTNIESVIANGTLCKRWKSTVSLVRLHLHTQGRGASQRATLLKAITKDIHDGLLSDRILQDALENIAQIRESYPKACKGLCSAISSYLKLALLKLDKASDDAHTPDLLHKCFKINVLFVLFSYLFGKNDKKIFNSLLYLDTKAHSIPLQGRCVWFPEHFLERYVGSLCASHPRQIQGVGRARQTYLATCRTNAAKHVGTLQLAAADWVLSMERLLGENEEQMNASQINLQSQLLLRGLQLVGEIKHFVVSIVSVHRAAGCPLGRSTLLQALRLCGALQAISGALHGFSRAVLRATHSVTQHLAYRAATNIDAVSKCVSEKKEAQKVHEMAYITLAGRALNGAVTHNRLIVTSVAVTFLPQATSPQLMDGQLALLINNITTLSTFSQTMKSLCDGSWLYWQSDIIPAYFEQDFLIKSEALQLKHTLCVLEDCGAMLRKVDHIISSDFSSKFAAEVQSYINNDIIKPTSQAIETDLRLHLHSHLRQTDADPFVGEAIKRSLLISGDFRHLQTHMSLTCGIENYLSTIYYNLTTLVLSDRRTYSEMRQMATFKFHLHLVDDELPTQTLEQGLDVLEIMRNIHVFVSRYLYNLNNQMFLERGSESKHLNTITIRHVANSIRAHGTGIMNTTVNFTYQFLKDKFYTFSQFMFDEHIKSRLARDHKLSRENIGRSESPYLFKSAEKFNKGIRNLGVVDDGQSYLDLFRGLITEVGNAMGYVRMVRSGGRHCCAGATVFLPSLDDTTSFKDLCEKDELSVETRTAAENLDHNMGTLVNDFTGGTEYFKLLVDVFAPVFRSSKNVHLKNFFMIVPPLTLNFVENIILAKDKMTKKDKTGAAFTDDGFAMGVAFILKLLDQDGELDGLHWFDAVWTHIANEHATLQQQKASGNEHLQRALALTEKRLMVQKQEFKLLYYSFSSARIFFQ